MTVCTETSGCVHDTQAENFFHMFLVVCVIRMKKNLLLGIGVKGMSSAAFEKQTFWLSTLRLVF